MLEIHKRIELLGLPMAQVAKWRRINNLLKKCKNVVEIEDFIRAGDEDSIKEYVYEKIETRASLVQEAKKLHVKSYGKMTKGELINAIGNYKKNKITRQRFER